MLGQWAARPSDVSLLVGPRENQILWLGAMAVLLLLIFVLTPLLRRDRGAVLGLRHGAVGCSRLCDVSIRSDAAVHGRGSDGADRKASHRRAGEFRARLAAASTAPAAWSNGWSPRGLPCSGGAVMLVARSAAPAGPECFRRMLYTTDPLDEAVRRQDLIVVNPPEAFGMLGSLLKWVGENEPVPRHTRVLVSSAFQPVHVYRPDATTLIVQPDAGFLAGRLDRLFRGEWRPFRMGDEIKLTGLTVEILQVLDDGRPAEVAFHFGVPLEDASLLALLEGRRVSSL